MNQQEVVEHYRENRKEIERRLDEFESLRDASSERWFKELAFVILTSQSGARNSWRAVEELESNSLLLEGSEDEIAEVLERNEIQYEMDKASYILENRNQLSQPTLDDPSGKIKLKDRVDPDRPEKSREWLVDNLSGIGWKGASHFLRNVGYGNGFAIISSRISSKMYELDLVESPENPSSREEYLSAEQKLKEFSKSSGIDIQALDLVLWSMETGEIFK
jgi:N-glycosylase/DNA lyase